MKWVETQGSMPRTKAAKVFVRYRCGLESKQAYPVKGQRWSVTGADFDIMAYAVPAERLGEAA
jgi:hypothetical protein